MFALIPIGIYYKTWVQDEKLAPFKAHLQEYRQPVVVPTPTPGETAKGYVRGKMVTMRGAPTIAEGKQSLNPVPSTNFFARKGSNELDPLFLSSSRGALSPEEVGTVAWLQWGSLKVGVYVTPGTTDIRTDALQSVCYLVVVDQKLHRVVTQERIDGPPPQRTIRGSQSGGGCEAEVTKYLEGLRRFSLDADVEKGRDKPASPILAGTALSAARPQDEKMMQMEAAKLLADTKAKQKAEEDAQRQMNAKQDEREKSARVERDRMETETASKAEMDARVGKSKSRALILYPEISDANSPLRRRFDALLQRYRSENPAFFDDPEWPLKLVREIQPLPSTVTLLEAVPFTIKRTSGGTGAITVPQGTRVKLIATHGDKVSLGYGEATATIDARLTSISGLE